MTLVLLPPIVDLGYARYEGTVSVSGKVASFLGVPYAEPPLGAWRFRKTVPLDEDRVAKGVVFGDKEDTISATTYKDMCLQGPLRTSELFVAQL